VSTDSFASRSEFEVGTRRFEIFRLDALQPRFDIARLPYSLKILLENLLRTEGNGAVTAGDIEALAGWDAKAEPSNEIAFSPARVLMQDFTGVPGVVDLAAMRDAIAALGGDPQKINPLVPAELVIDHSVQVDVFGRRDAFARNAEREFERNVERYAFLRWGQDAFDNFAVVPPDTGICHQVNLEYLARVVFAQEASGSSLPLAYPDTVVGTDSHTPMVNGLGVLGWGVGGIEAEAAMLGQPMSMLVPQVIGFRLHGAMREGTTATDLVLTIAELLRAKGVVGRFVEFFGAGLANLPLADRATIGNMSPEFGSTVSIFPIDRETLRYLEFTGRPTEQIELVEAYAREQGLWHDENAVEPVFTDTVELDLGDVVPSIAGPRRPQDRVLLSEAQERYHEALATYTSTPKASGGAVAVAERLEHGHVVIAAITSCTNTSNPAVMVGAGLLARNAVARGLEVKPWVKTSLAPGSMVVTDYLERAGLTEPLEALGYHLVGYGCTTCIGNSGPLDAEISREISERDLTVAAVLSGNRNFEGRINPDTKMNYLASPPLVVAYAIAGTMDIDLLQDSLGEDGDGEPVYLRDIWPSAAEIAETVEQALQSSMYLKRYSTVYDGDEHWKALEVPGGDRFEWAEDSTYVRLPPFFENLQADPDAPADIAGARALAVLGDSVTTDHISPAGAIKRDSPAGRYLQEHGVEPAEFNSYGARRGNHEVLMRGTFANIRLHNLLGAAGRESLPEGGVTRHMPDGEELSIYDAAMRYADEGVPLVVLGGKEYGSGSSRDWAAKGPRLLGVRAVVAQSFERIHRSNLVGMGILPLQFLEGDSVASLGLTGEETFAIDGFAAPLAAGELPEFATVTADAQSFRTRVRIDTPMEVQYYCHGGILSYVLRKLSAS
jgi:aconitate hydratase